MPTRFKEPPTIQHAATIQHAPTIQRAPYRTGELPAMPLPEHPFLDKRPLPDATVSEDAPHPIGVDPSVTGAFSTISAADGTAPIPTNEIAAHLTNHGAHVRTGGAPVKRGFPKVAIALVAAIAVCLVAGTLLIFRNLSAADADAAEVEGQRIEQSVAVPGQPVYYDSYAYTLLQQDDGRWALVRSVPTGADPLVLFTLDGSPVDLVFHHGTFLVPENFDGSWDVAAWAMGDGAIVTSLMGEDGEPIGGEGRLASAKLEGDTLELSTEDGTVTPIPLDF